MKNFKRLVSIIIVVSMLIMGSIGAIATGVSDTSQKDTKSYSINEYELLKNLDDEQLAKINEKVNEKSIVDESTETYGNNKKETKNLTKYSKKITKEQLIKEYKEKIYRLKEWKVEELNNVGYNETQINAIKNFDGSEELMALAATTVDVNIGLRNLVYSSGTTKVDVIADFNCAGIQSNWFLDIFAVVWSAPLTLVDSTGTVRYVNSNGESVYYTHTPVNDGNLYGQAIKFHKYKSDGNPAYYVHSGSMIINLKSNTTVLDIAALASYGYNTFTSSVSFSTSGLGISFSGTIKTVGEDYDSN